MKKGFTLIEVISVIVILGIIGLIAVPIANNITKSSKEKLYNEQVDRIIDACKNYVLEDDRVLPEEEDGSVNTVDIGQLKAAGLITNDDIKNPLTNELMSGIIEITYFDKEYNYRYIDAVYYAAEGDGLHSVNDDSILSMRPSSKNAYIRYSLVGKELKNPEVCFYRNAREFCLKTNNYEESRARILKYFEFDEYTWRNAGTNENGVTDYYADNGLNLVCHISNLQVDCGDDNVRAGASLSGTVNAGHSNSYVCQIRKDGKITCVGH